VCAGLWIFCLTGCYDATQVNAFLQKPRKAISGAEYRVLPPDTIQIISRHMPEITGIIQQVSPAGRINLPLVGELEVAGKTPRQIEQMIMDGAKDYYEQVDATVSVVGYNSQKYFIFGEVARPGPEVWTGHDTLLDALAKARPTFLAWPKRIYVVRGDEPQEGGREMLTNPKKYKNTGITPETPGNPRRIIMFNLMAMVESGDLTNNILLKPNDVIYVQPNPLARAGLAVQSLLFPVRPAIEMVGAPSQIGNPGRTGY
jgi:polysaccharide export outer membrane protein